MNSRNGKSKSYIEHREYGLICLKRLEVIMHILNSMNDAHRM